MMGDGQASLRVQRLRRQAASGQLSSPMTSNYTRAIDAHFTFPMILISAELRGRSSSARLALDASPKVSPPFPPPLDLFICIFQSGASQGRAERQREGEPAVQWNQTRVTSSRLVTETLRMPADEPLAAAPLVLKTKGPTRGEAQPAESRERAAQ